MTKDYPFPKNDILGSVNKISSNAQNTEGFSPEACQTIFEFMAKAKADHLKREQLIHETVQEFEQKFAQGNLSKY